MCYTGPYYTIPQPYPIITPNYYPNYYYPPKPQTIEDRLDNIEKELKELKELIGRLK